MSTALQSLWVIEEELSLLMDSLEFCSEDLQPELQSKITNYLNKETAKVDQVAHVLAALEYEDRCAADEQARLQERRKIAQKSKARLEQYVCRVIQARGLKRISGTTNTLSVRASEAVLISDESTIPARFITEKVVVTKSIDKIAIKAALKAGGEIPGADLEFRQNLVRR